jgi:hypothetical protein
MMVKLSKPSSTAKDIMKQLGIEMVTFKDEMTGAMRVDFPASIEKISKGLKSIEDPMERARASAELFGLRGQKAANAFVVAGAEGLVELNEKIKKADGTAKEMAATRLDNFAGQVTLLSSAMEGFAIEAFGPIMGPLTDTLRDMIIPAIQGVVQVMQKLKDAVTTDDIAAIRAEFGDTLTDVALGIADAISTLRDGFNWLVTKAKELSERFGESGVNAKQVAKIVTMVVLIGAALAPVILGFLTFGLVIGGTIQIISGLATVLAGAFLPVLLIVGVLLTVFEATRREGESFGDTMIRLWGQFKTVAMQVWTNALKPLFEGMRDAATVIWPLLRDTLIEAFGTIKAAFVDLLATLGITFNSTKSQWREWGQSRGEAHQGLRARHHRLHRDAVHDGLESAEHDLGRLRGALQRRHHWRLQEDGPSHR